MYSKAVNAKYTSTNSGLGIENEQAKLYIIQISLNNIVKCNWMPIQSNNQYWWELLYTMRENKAPNSAMKYTMSLIRNCGVNQ